nr:MAG TPA: hypothetical protein [Caudoviricetes sp.]
MCATFAYIYIHLSTYICIWIICKALFYRHK